MTDTDDARALAKKTVGYLKRMDWLDYKPAVEQEFAKVITRAKCAEAEAAALREALRGFVNVADHTRVFLSSREKMHPQGIELWDMAVHKGRAALKAKEAERG